MGQLDKGQLIEKVMEEPFLDGELHDDQDETFIEQKFSNIMNPVHL